MIKTASMISAVVLAAGCSRRMGNSNKLIELIDGTPMIRRVLDSISNSRVDHCVVVTGHDAEKICDLLSLDKIDVVFNADFDRGLSSSLHTGISALPEYTEAALIVLGDMPDITPQIFSRLIDCFENHQKQKICIPTFEGKRGNPVLWPRRFFPDLSETSGDNGGRQLFNQLGEHVVECDVDDQAVLKDIDTTEQLMGRNLNNDETS